MFHIQPNFESNIPLRSFSLLKSLRQRLNQIEIRDAKLAHFLCRAIPMQCPFERNIYFLGCQITYIPPLCKFNPFYEELIGLRFRALSYLADECQEDIRCYC